MEEKIQFESKSWYRGLKVLGIGLVMFSFFAPLFHSGSNHSSDKSWVVDGIVNVILWTIILLILKKVLVYVMYGKVKSKQDSESILKQKLTIDKVLVGKLAKVILIIFAVFIVISLLFIFLPLN